MKKWSRCYLHISIPNLIFYSYCTVGFTLRLHNLQIKYPKMTAWRQAGLNYINYSNIAARTVRRALKQELRVDALKRDQSIVRITPWANGKPAHLQAAAK